jgi:energy-coupling factor transporter ATP-binding protein EcfA2
MAVVVFTGATLRFRRDLAPGRRRHARSPSPSREAGRSRRDLRGARPPPCGSAPRLPRRRDGGGEPGSVVAVVGGDGAGKTTLLRALVGEVPSTRAGDRCPRPRRIGYLPASAGSWAALTVRRTSTSSPASTACPGDALASRRGRAARPRGRLTTAADRWRRSCRAGCAASSASAWRWCTTRAAGARRAQHRRRPGEPGRPVAAGHEAAASGAAVVMSTTYLDEAERAASLLVLDGGRVLARARGTTCSRRSAAPSRRPPPPTGVGVAPRPCVPRVLAAGPRPLRAWRRARPRGRRHRPVAASTSARR